MRQRWGMRKDRKVNRSNSAEWRMSVKIARKKANHKTRLVDKYEGHKQPWQAKALPKPAEAPNGRSNHDFSWIEPVHLH
jgi:hypothetical protein